MECSIIIPYFNRKELLLNTLRSLEMQSFDKDRFEVIVVDDGSESRADEELNSYGFTINIRYYYLERNEHSGASFARNLGIRKAAGDILIFLDCDQIVKSNYIEKNIQVYKGLGGDLRIIQIGMRKSLKGPYTMDCLDDISSDEYEPDIRYRVFEMFSYNMALIKGGWRLLYSHNFSIRKDLMIELGGFDENFKGWGLEDIELGYRAYRNGVKIVFNPNIEACHQFHDEVWDSARNFQWQNNLRYFNEKHNELPVRMQEIFDFYDPDDYAGNEKLKTKDDWDDEWLERFARFENALRIINGECKQDNKREIFLSRPSIEEINRIQNRYNYSISVGCLKEDMELIVSIQADDKYSLIKLFII